jgi:tetratricopeptide (TPR) repeat protein
LIDAHGFQAWASDPLQRDLQHIFALHDEVAGLIAKNLSLKLGVVEASPTVANPEAYQHLLQARFFSRGDTNDGWRRSVDECKAAVLLDENLAPAWAEMARSYIQLARFSGLGLAEAFAGARTAAERAVLLGPQLAEAHNAMGWVQRTADWNWREADASFRRAYDLAPGNARIISDYAILRNNTGHFAEAIELGRRAVALDPLNASTRAHLSLFLGWAGHYDEAVTEIQRALPLAPTAAEWHAYLARFELLRGNVDAAATAAEAEVSERYRLILRAFVLASRKDRVAADRVMQEVIERFSDREAGYIGEYYAWAGEPDLAFTWLERAREHRETTVVWSLGQRTLDKLHTDPRWPAFVRKLGLAADQLK